MRDPMKRAPMRHVIAILPLMGALLACDDDASRSIVLVVVAEDGGMPDASDAGERSFRPGRLNFDGRNEEAIGPDCHPPFMVDGRCRPRAGACGEYEVADIASGCVAVGPEVRPRCTRSPHAARCRHEAAPVPGDHLADERPVGVVECAERFRFGGRCQPQLSLCEPGSIATPRSGCLPLDGPEGCGPGKWGHIVLREGDVHVDAEAPPDGDGTRQAPFQRLNTALNAVPLNGRVVLAAGVHPSGMIPQRSMTIEGKCASQVRIVPWQDQRPVLSVRGAFDITVRGISIGDAPDEPERGETVTGIEINRGALHLERVHISRFGLGLHVLGGEVLLTESLMSDPRLSPDGHGQAIQVIGNGRLTVERATFDRAGIASTIFADGGRVTLSDVYISGTRPRADGTASGLIVKNGAQLTAVDTVIEGTGDGDGASVFDASLDLTRVAVRGPEDASSLVAFFPVYGEGARLRLEASVFERGCGMGISVVDGTLALHDSLVADVRTPSPAAFAAWRERLGGDELPAWQAEAMGFGVFVAHRRGSAYADEPVVVRGSTVRGAHFSGIMVSDAPLTVERSVVAETRIDDALVPEIGWPVAGNGISYIGPQVIVRESSLIGNAGAAVLAAAASVVVEASLVADQVGTRFGDLTHAAALTLFADTVEVVGNHIVANASGEILVAARRYLDEIGGTVLAHSALGPADAPWRTPEGPLTATVRHNLSEANGCADGALIAVEALYDNEITANTLRDNCGWVGIQVASVNYFLHGKLPDDLGETRLARNLVLEQRMSHLSGAGGIGVGCAHGVTCHLDGDILINNQLASVLLSGPGGTATLNDVLIEGTHRVSLDYHGYGIAAMGSVQTTVTGSVLLNNHTAGIMAFDDARIDIYRTQVAGTRRGYYALDKGERGVRDGLGADAILTVEARVGEVDEVELFGNERSGIYLDYSQGEIKRARVAQSPWCVYARDSVAGISYEAENLHCEHNDGNVPEDDVPDEVIAIRLGTGDAARPSVIPD